MLYRYLQRGTWKISLLGDPALSATLRTQMLFVSLSTRPKNHTYMDLIKFTHLLVAGTFDEIQNKQQKINLDDHKKHDFEDENLELSSIIFKVMCPNIICKRY